MEIRHIRYDHPDAVKLTDQVQQEYVERYGSGDATPMDAAHFAPPHGLFLVGYLEGAPVATGGWRSPTAAAEGSDDPGDPDGLEDGDAELKRMYVVPHARGLGLARRMLARLETTAIAAGRTRMVLETGPLQPEAVALYISCGYAPIRKFGVYRHEPSSICLGKTLDGS